MNILVLDTTKQAAFVCAKLNEQNFYKIISETKKHSEDLLNEIDLLLSSVGANLNDFDAFGAVTGPGSFTGIRIAMSTVKAFSYALSKKIVSANVFEVVKGNVTNGYVIIKNTSTTCYFAKIENSEIKTTGIVNNSELNILIKNEKAYAISEEHLEELNAYINLNLINNYEELLLTYFYNKLESGNTISINEFSPYYMQLSQAERELEAKND